MFSHILALSRTTFLPCAHPCPSNLPYQGHIRENHPQVSKKLRTLHFAIVQYLGDAILTTFDAHTNTQEQPYITLRHSCLQSTYPRSPGSLLSPYVHLVCPAMNTDFSEIAKHFRFPWPQGRPFHHVIGYIYIKVLCPRILGSLACSGFGAWVINWWRDDSVMLKRIVTVVLPWVFASVYSKQLPTLFRIILIPEVKDRGVDCPPLPVEAMYQDLSPSLLAILENSNDNKQKTSKFQCEVKMYTWTQDP